MRDAHLSILAILLSDPGRPLKYYADLCGMARASFFKAKQELEMLGVVEFDAQRRLTVNLLKARDHVYQRYRGLQILCFLTKEEGSFRGVDKETQQHADENKKI